MVAFGGLSQARASGFHGSGVQTPPGPVPGVVRGDLRTKYQKLTQIAHVMAPGYDETKSNLLTRTCMWAKNIFQSIFSFFLGIFGGNNLFGRT